MSDSEDEENETFFLDVSNAVGGTILDGRGTGTILDDQNFLVYRGQQKDGTAGVQGLDGPWGVAVSPDGDHLYICLGIVTVAFDNGDGIGTQGCGPTAWTMPDCSTIGFSSG